MKNRNLQLRRKQLKLTVKTVAEILEVPVSRVYKLEEGLTNPSVKLIVKLAKAYQCSIDDIFRDLNLI